MAPRTAAAPGQRRHGLATASNGYAAAILDRALSPHEPCEPRPRQCMPPADQRPIAITALRCRIRPFIRSRRRAARAAGRRLRPASALGARPARAGPRVQGVADQSGSPGTKPGTVRGAVSLGAPLSRSRSPRRGRSLRSRRMRSASPNLDPAPTCQGWAPVEDDGAEQATGVGLAVGKTLQPQTLLKRVFP